MSMVECKLEDSWVMISISLKGMLLSQKRGRGLRINTYKRRKMSGWHKGKVIPPNLIKHCFLCIYIYKHKHVYGCII